jgi:predicted heme/steroid binding protein
MNALFSEIEYLIRLLYVTHDVQMKNLTLNQLWNKVEQLRFVTQLKQAAPNTQPYPNQQPQLYPQQFQSQLQQPLQPQPQQMIQSTAPSAALPAAQQPVPATVPNQQTLTREQLAQFNGKNGKPAYVAVRGIVYDVTNNAAWSAASHFGLTAGKDLTQEFASCHAAEQWILNTLTPVGRLIE